MKVLTLKRAAGRISFGPDEELDIPDEEAQALIDCGAVVPVEKQAPAKADKPKKPSARELDAMRQKQLAENAQAARDKTDQG